MHSLASRLKEQARSLGFELVGTAPAVSAPGAEPLRAWLEKGCAGEMSYMELHAGAREHPRSVLPEVRSVVMVGMNYRTRRNPSPQPSPQRGEGEDHPHGRVACYAWGEDYHE